MGLIVFSIGLTKHHFSIYKASSAFRMAQTHGNGAAGYFNLSIKGRKKCSSRQTVGVLAIFGQHIESKDYSTYSLRIVTIEHY